MYVSFLPGEVSYNNWQMPQAGNRLEFMVTELAQGPFKSLNEGEMGTALKKTIGSKSTIN